MFERFTGRGNRGREGGIPPTPEQRSTIKEVRLGVEFEHMETFLHWMQNPIVSGHLDPLPRFPDWTDKRDVSKANLELWDYYRNLNHESKIYDPDGVLPMTAYNQFGEPIGVLTIRWRGDKYVPKDKRIAAVERVVVDPELHGKGIGTNMMKEAIDYSFNKYKGYSSGQGAEEMRAWVFVDGTATGFEKNIRLMHRLGFGLLRHERGAWSKYAKLLGIDTDREAYWYKLDKETFQIKHENPISLTQNISQMSEHSSQYMHC